MDTRPMNYLFSMCRRSFTIVFQPAVNGMFIKHIQKHPAMRALTKGLISRNQITKGSTVCIILLVYSVHYKFKLTERKWAIRKQKFRLILYLILLNSKVFHQFS